MASGSFHPGILNGLQPCILPRKWFGIMNIGAMSRAESGAFSPYPLEPTLEPFL